MKAPPTVTRPVRGNGGMMATTCFAGIAIGFLAGVAFSELALRPALPAVVAPPTSPAISADGDSGELFALDGEPMAGVDGPGLGYSRRDLTHGISQTYQLKIVEESKELFRFGLGPSVLVSLHGPSQDVRRIVIVGATEDVSGGAATDFGRAIAQIGGRLPIGSVWLREWLSNASTRVAPEYTISTIQDRFVVSLAGGEIDDVVMAMLSIERSKE